ncbi:hypothetical protein EST38_g10515 [Candolleomyces aberdarensis]|uniref:LITAF domain-containing protein n=1 Tax=Candolleomyces aberdarensis TaxID=2316362 RepID=A0A4Q2D8T5_9AGAR|nr:hypothetical protein EST38_g10515 [Candolleomyces aberdarensis]
MIDKSQESGGSDRPGQESSRPSAKELEALAPPIESPEQQATPSPQPQFNAGSSTAPLASFAAPPAYSPSSAGSISGHPEQQQYAPTPAPHVLAHQAPTPPPVAYATNGQSGRGPVVEQKGVPVTTVIDDPKPLALMGPGTTSVVCPHCKEHMMTSITYKVGNFTHLIGIAFCMTTLMPCIPYLIDPVKDVRHSCSKCGVLLATYRRGAGTVEVHAVDIEGGSPR